MSETLKEAQEKAHKEYVKMVKSHILDFLKEHPVYRLSELWDQRRISPLSEMSLTELTKFLNEYGLTIMKTTDYVISKR